MDSGPAIAEQPRHAWPGVFGRPVRRHWWSIQPPPAGNPISARRAYLEVLGVFAVFFAAGVIAGGETLARRYPAPSGSWAVFVPAAVSELSLTALALIVTISLSARRGITPRSLGLGLPRNASGGAAWPAFRMGVWAVVALAVGGLVTSLLAAGKLGQPVRQDDSYLLYSTAASLAAGVVEETVVLAFVVTTLRQAGRPLAEVVLVAVALRCSYHDYYGPGVAGIAIWAAIFVWLFLRTASIVPLMVVHFAWDATIFWSQRWQVLLGARVIFALLAIVVAAISWLAEAGLRGGGGQAPPETAGR